jgi:hypothetical protein
MQLQGAQYFLQSQRKCGDAVDVLRIQKHPRPCGNCTQSLLYQLVRVWCGLRTWTRPLFRVKLMNA